MNWKELIQSEEFQEYRRREIEEGAEFLRRLWTGENPECVRGALLMLSRIIRLPKTFSDLPETKEFMGTIVERDFSLFEAKFLRKHLMETEDE